MKKFTVNENCTLKQFTDFNYPQGAFAWSALMKKRDIKVNGSRKGTNVALKIGDEVEYYTTPLQERAPTHFTVYEDANVIICDKFSGVTSEGLLSELSSEMFCRAVHRLDRNTQGLIIFAKTAEAERELLAAFRERRIAKKYLAICKDNFKKDGDILKGWLKKDSEKALVNVSEARSGGAELIITEYKIIDRHDGLSLVEIVLHTGKTHQIRAHMAHIGCPVLGDEKYGDVDLNKKYAARRQRLVAKFMKFDLCGNLAYLNGKTFESSFKPEI